jgi:A/G-specific adenine glycosylase
MLQQTRVATVVPFYERFMARFPTANALASARESDALALWEGLGYYRRLRNLRAAAQVIHQDGWQEDLRDLPGVGTYTAATVGSIAFDRMEACADGNVRRVMSRLNARDCSTEEAQSQSSILMGKHSAGEWNQAVMELGAVICHPKQPDCQACPITKFCAARRLGTAESLPTLPTANSIRVDHVYACAIRGRQIGVRKCAKDEWWHGMYTFPRMIIEGGEPSEPAAERLGLRKPKFLGSFTHVVTNHCIRVHAFSGGAGEGLTVEWRGFDELAKLPMSRPARRVLQWLEDAR